MPNSLLPTGFYDTLPPEADQRSHVLGTLLASFAAFGYDQVAPPLAEFATPGQEDGAFCVTDANTRRMMRLRADMTPPVMRLAASRLRHVPRPLRIAYSGNVLRTEGEGKYAARQIMQAGIELIGGPVEAADHEILMLVQQNLHALGLTSLAIEVSVPGLLPLLLAQTDMSASEYPTWAARFAAKDLHAPGAAPFKNHPAFATSMQLCYASDLPTIHRLIAELKAQCEGNPAATLVQALEGYLSMVENMMPEITPSLDLLTGNRTPSYHSGICFTMMGGNEHEVLVRGGQYQLENAQGEPEHGTGATFLVDAWQRAVGATPSHKRVYLPFGTKEEEARQLREEGYQTLYALREEEDFAKAAAQQRCDACYVEGKIQAVASLKHAD